MSMTWNELSIKIALMTPEQRATDLTFFDTNDGEFDRIGELRFTDEKNCDILGHDHPYLDGWE